MLLSKTTLQNVSRFSNVSRALLLSGLLSISLNACGFEPIYAHKESGFIKSELESVHINPVPDRVGQELRNNLYDVLSPRGQTDQPRWYLSITLAQSTQHIAIDEAAFSTRANMQVSASFKLKHRDPDPTTTFSGTAKAISSYNILDSDYATLIAERDAQSRAVKSLGKDIARQLALWMRNLDD